MVFSTYFSRSLHSLYSLRLLLIGRCRRRWWRTSIVEGFNSAKVSYRLEGIIGLSSLKFGWTLISLCYRRLNLSFLHTRVLWWFSCFLAFRFCGFWFIQEFFFVFFIFFENFLLIKFCCTRINCVHLQSMFLVIWKFSYFILFFLVYYVVYQIEKVYKVFVICLQAYMTMWIIATLIL